VQRAAARADLADDVARGGLGQPPLGLQPREERALEQLEHEQRARHAAKVALLEDVEELEQVGLVERRDLAQDGDLRREQLRVPRRGAPRHHLDRDASQPHALQAEPHLGELAAPKPVLENIVVLVYAGCGELGGFDRLDRSESRQRRWCGEGRGRGGER
jgi:hypothetical protein